MAETPERLLVIVIVRQRAGLIGILGMKVVNSFCFIVELSWLPFGFRPSSPPNQVLQATAGEFGVQDLVDIVFLLAVYFDWGWWRSLLPGKRVVVSRVK